jgi:hypothetical protein
MKAYVAYTTSHNAYKLSFDKEWVSKVRRLGKNRAVSPNWLLCRGATARATQMKLGRSREIDEVIKYAEYFFCRLAELIPFCEGIENGHFLYVMRNFPSTVQIATAPIRDLHCLHCTTPLLCCLQKYITKLGTVNYF